TSFCPSSSDALLPLTLFQFQVSFANSSSLAAILSLEGVSGSLLEVIERYRNDCDTWKEAYQEFYKVIFSLILTFSKPLSLLTSFGLKIHAGIASKPRSLAPTRQFDLGTFT